MGTLAHESDTLSENSLVPSPQVRAPGGTLNRASREQQLDLDIKCNKSQTTKQNI